jgi:hypothetical protein
VLPALEVCRHNNGKFMEDKMPPAWNKAKIVGECAPNNSGFGDRFKRNWRPEPINSAENP